MADPYTVLGVTKSADEKAIKSAFRKLAKKYHPDQNKDDKNAQTKFAAVNQAYEILGDKEKRGQYDRGEIDEKGQQKFSGFQNAGGDPFSQFRTRGAAGNGQEFHGSFGGAEDILNEFFGSAFGGTNQRGGFTQSRGFGGGPQRTAPNMDIELNALIGIDELMRGKASVTMPDGKRISVSVPPEVENGQTVRLKGKGKSAPGRPSGDALVTFKVKESGNLTRQGANLRLDAPVDLETAVMGGKIAVETPDGKIALKIPEGTNSGKVMRLKGKGLSRKGGGTGDLLVNIVIQLSDSAFAELKKFYSGN